MIQDLGFCRNLRQILGKAGFGRRNGDLGNHLTALRLHRGGKEVAVIVTKGIVREHHRDLLAKIGRNPWGHRGNLAAHIGDAGLQRPAVQRARGDVIAFRANKIRNLQLTRARGRSHDDMAKQRAKDQFAAMLIGQLVDHFGTALGVGAIVFIDQLDRSATNAAHIVDHLRCRIGGALIPAAIAGTDAGRMQLEPQLQRCPLRHHRAHQPRRRQKSRTHPGKNRAPGGRKSIPILRCHGLSSSVVAGLRSAASPLMKFVSIRTKSLRFS